MLDGGKDDAGHTNGDHGVVEDLPVLARRWEGSGAVWAEGDPVCWNIMLARYADRVLEVISYIVCCLWASDSFLSRDVPLPSP